MRILDRIEVLFAVAVLIAGATPASGATPATTAGPGAPATLGYYREPAIHGNWVVFVAEADLWKVSADGGLASRLTSHPGREGNPTISPDGTTVAFRATYEGPDELYTIPFAGGLPIRQTYLSSGVVPVGWTSDGRVLAATDAYATLPDDQLLAIRPSSGGGAGAIERIELAQAADGCFDDTGDLFFTRLPFHGSHTKRYKGGTAPRLWTLARGAEEAVPLTADYDGTSKNPMWWQDRVYFLSDRDGTMNIWSMTSGGTDARQHTHHSGWDTKGPALSEGRIVYQLGADLRLFTIETGEDRAIEILLGSDLDQTREHWIDKPISYMTSAHISPDGERIAITARGKVFVAPRRQGRLVDVDPTPGIRRREARFSHDGKGIFCLADASGEVEVWRLPSDGVGTGERITTGAQVLRWDAVPSPDGRWLAHHDKNQRLFVHDLKLGKDQQIDSSGVDNFSDLTWSPDSRWLAYVAPGENLFRRIRIHDMEGHRTFDATSDRYDSSSPCWSPDGDWIYFLSERNLDSAVHGVWGIYQPEPFFGKPTKIYQLALRSGLRSPFAPPDELHPEDAEADEAERGEDDGDKEERKDKGKASGRDEMPPRVEILADGLQARLAEVPLPPGRYSNLMVTSDALFWISREPVETDDGALMGVGISREELEPKVVAAAVSRVELSRDGRKILLQKGESLHVIDADPSEDADLEKTAVDLSAFRLSVDPPEEWRQMFTEAWRLERDYFYDPAMHGIDWRGIREKYMPLADRIRSRGELSDLLAQMVSELSALHIYVYGGDLRTGPDDVQPADLGALLARDETRGGYRVDRIYRSDPDEPSLLSPLARPGVEIREGDVIERINGVTTLSVPDVRALLRDKADEQVLIHVLPASGGEARSLIVRPIGPEEAANLRYRDWELSRRERVEELGKGEIGYVHLRAMGSGNYTEWAKGFYPVFTRKGLVVDVRHNRGGNIDSWILGRLLRRAWFHWSQRVGNPPSWNMQYAFRGHVVVLCDEWTMSDGEAFAEGIRRLGLGEVIGTRTWGGEIWLTSSNVLVDKGIATSAEFGVYGPEGSWLIEGRGVEPDIVVDNLPRATFRGADAQLERAVARLQEKIRREPIPDRMPPAFPDKSR